MLKKDYIHIQTMKKFLAKQGADKCEDSPVVIKDLDFTIKKGELIGIVAQVGHGKTSFFNALLGEMRLAPQFRKAFEKYEDGTDVPQLNFSTRT